MIRKTIIKNMSLLFTLTAVILLILSSCTKIEREAKVITGVVRDISSYSAKVDGDVVDLGEGITLYGHCWSVIPDPETADSKTSLGNRANPGQFTSNLSSLQPGTKYYVWAYAQSGEDVIYGDATSFTTRANNITFNPSLNYGTVKDIDGNEYRTIRIGTQNWMAENLKTTRYQDGNFIIHGLTDNDWTYANQGLYTNYNNDPGYDPDYGKLYNWFAIADSRNICPVGWHVPTKDEWQILVSYSFGGKLKESGTLHWESPNTGATNESGFTALPGGLRNEYNFAWIGQSGLWWSSTPYWAEPEWPEATGFHGSSNYGDFVEDNAIYLRRGLSVRCLEGPPVITLPYVKTSGVLNISSNTASCGGLVNSEGYGTVTIRGVCWSTSENPTVSNSRTTDGSGSGTFTSNITGLTPNTTYYVRAYAINSVGTAYGEEISFTTDPITVTDADGNVYNAVMLGNQVWMAENLKTTRFNDGSIIPLVTDITAWSNLTTSGYCWYENNEAANKNLYGALYNWYAVDTEKLCPSGWHVPTDSDWSNLVSYLISHGYNYDGTTSGNKIAKAMASTTGWSFSSNAGAVGNTDYPEKRNATGFSALPGGCRGDYGDFFNRAIIGYWWTSSEEYYSSATLRVMYYDLFDLDAAGMDKNFGFYVRCLKD